MKTYKGVNKKRTRTEDSDVATVSDSFRSFKELLPVIQSPQGMKPEALKKLHGLLVILSSEAKWTNYKYEIGSHDFDLEMYHNGIQVRYGDICELSDILFKELEERFEQCLSNMCDISDNKDLRRFSSCFVLFETVEVVNFLLRCCMVLILLTASSHIRDKGTILLRILRKLNLLNSADKNGKCDSVFEKSAFHEFPAADNGFHTSCAEKFTASLHFLEPYNQLLYFKSTVLEVFVEELLMNNKLIGYLNKIDSAASVDDRQFSQSAQGDIGILVELICYHFILKFSDKQLFGDFLTRLFCLNEKELTHLIKAPALQVTAARCLLSSPVMVAAPKYVIAHMVSLVSEAMDSMTKGSKPDLKLINCFLLTFEQSITLYTEHMSCFQTYTCPSRAKTPSFDSYISADLKNKIHSLINELDQSLNPNLHDTFSEMKPGLVNSSMSFVKECQHMYDASCQDEIMNILSCLILKTSESFDEAAIHSIECTSLQHIFLQASLLKLLSISLLQIIRCLRHGDEFCCLKTLKDFSSCKEYDFILGAIACFKDLDFSSLPLQQVLSKAMSSYPTRHTDSKLLFLHFAGLMSLSFASGLDCLVKGCLLGVIALLNLFVFEGGNLDALQSIVTSHSESFSASSAVVIFQKAVVGNNSALVVASKFKNMRSRHLRLMGNKCEDMSHMEPGVAVETRTEETCSAEIIYKCMGENAADCEDLNDFIECTKEFPTWLSIRKTYCRKKLELSWKRKKKSWKTLKGKRRSNFRNA